jgi:CYTH domain-containing protein
MEIERKWRVDAEALPGGVLAGAGEEIEQGYLAIEPDGREVRMRRRAGRCTMSVKTGRGLAREEAEVELRADQFEALWVTTEGRRLEKVRRLVEVEGGTAEVDVYSGSLAGLVVAEVEFDDERAAERFVAPDWFGPELTGEVAYSNQRLAVDGLPAP